MNLCASRPLFYHSGMGRATSLGQYLRARRELVRPEDVGLASLGRRRVPGLRREELATLAGISADYYLRLEQGRDHRPSAQVIDALARALQLDKDATAHLHSLASSAVDRHRRDEPEQVAASVKHLIASWTNTPAFVIGRRLNVLAANVLASALSPALSPGVNLVRATFLDCDVRRLVGDAWDDVAQTMVARLRSQVGLSDDDPRLAELVAELSRGSDRFQQLWARHDIQVVASPPRTFHHPLVGPLELLHELLAIAGTEGQIISVYHAVPGSPAERALRRLAAIATIDPKQGAPKGPRTRPQSKTINLRRR